MNLSQTDARMVLDRDGKNISDKIGYLNEQLADIAINIKDYGAIPNNFTDAVAEANYNALVAAVKTNKKVVVKEKYYIKVTTTSNLVSQNLIIDGENKGELILVYASTTPSLPVIFTLEPTIKNVSIKGLKLTNNSAWICPRFMGGNYKNDSEKNIFNADTFTVEECVVNGLWVLFNPKSPKLSISRFKEVIIKASSFVNVTSKNYATMLVTPVFFFENYSYNTIIIESLDVNNCVLFFYDGIANSNSQFVDKKLFICKNNKMINDDDWFLNGNAATYNCFVLSEGYNIQYSGNHVEGIKTNHNNAVAYDAYLTGAYVTYENNVFKNILKMVKTAGGYNSVIFKEKGKYNNVGKRIIRNNTAYVSKEWIDRIITIVGVEVSSSYALLENTDSGIMEEVIFENNTVYIEHHLVTSVGSVAYSVSVKNNHISAIQSDVILLYLYRSDDLQVLDIKGIICTNNVITDINLPKSNFTASAYQQTLLYCTKNINLQNVIVLDNHIHTYGMAQFIRTEPEALIEKMRIEGNKLLCYGDDIPDSASLYFYLDTVNIGEKCVINNNTIENPNKYTYHPFRFIGDKLEVINTAITSPLNKTIRELLRVNKSFINDELTYLTLNVKSPSVIDTITVKYKTFIRDGKYYIGYWNASNTYIEYDMIYHANSAVAIQYIDMKTIYTNSIFPPSTLLKFGVIIRENTPYLYIYYVNRALVDGEITTFTYNIQSIKS
ncbi:hypothetical protein [Peribacillus simplex]|uniref:hypothetical protein n=1 Tax=Peribacillus simplex TaxID=1478 RepID=UPI003D2ACA50